MQQQPNKWTIAGMWLSLIGRVILLIPFAVFVGLVLWAIFTTH